MKKRPTVSSASARAGARSTKLLRILKVFADGGSLNRFEAERIGEHCLNTTVATLQRRGLRIDRKPERVPNRFGGMTRCLRYWLAADQWWRARDILGTEDAVDGKEQGAGR